MRTGIVLADDFTGAAECAAQWARAGRGAILRLDVDTVVERDDADVLPVLDLHTRGLAPDAAAAVVSDALATVSLRVGELDRPGAAGLVFKKIDSLWRGNVASELGALASAGYTVVLAGALPELGRAIVDGVPLLDGVPLAETNAWAVEPGTAPARVSDLFEAELGSGVKGQPGAGHLPRACVRVEAVSLSMVRAGAEALALAFLATMSTTSRLRSTASRPSVLVVDSETIEDLETVAAAVEIASPDFRSAGRPLALAGTGGLASVLASRERTASERDNSASPDSAVAPDSTQRPVLVVVGSASQAARDQCEALAAAELKPRTATELGDAVDDLARDGAVLLTAPEAVGDPQWIATEIAAAAGAVLDVAPDADLILTGGETSRRILTRLGIVELGVEAQLEHGVVLCRAPDGRRVITKPGSFGSPGVLTTALHYLRGHHTPTLTGEFMTTNSADARPFIAVTMGDGAGVGPEVTVGALLDERAYRESRPIVIGDVTRLRLGAEALGVSPEIVEIERVGEAVFEPGRINVIDPHLLSADLPWGKESAEAGNAAYHYIRIACELGMAGEIQGICTAPLNKAALHSAGHVYPGHTELLAHFMGVEEVSMMLSTPKLRVIHVTTHIGLIDAIAKIEPGLVERTVRRGDEALKRAGIERPRIGVCAINPHAGENGLFGYGEEAEKIVPALEVLRADGIDAVGPLPADTAFFLAGRGDYDLIVAMYHDQGHGPVKVLGIEAGVNITVGLPVIRTSVDHGTAFDIAGKGTVEIGSMIEALHQAAQLSPSPSA